MIKMFPKNGEFTTERKVKLEGSYLELSYEAVDEDKDKFDLAVTQSFVFDGTDDSKVKILNDLNLSCVRDMKEVLKAISTSRKIGEIEKNILILDVITVFEFFRNNGIGKYVMNDYIELAKEEGYDMIVLKAHPVVSWKLGISASLTKREVSNGKKMLKCFYESVGFERIRKSEEFMMLKL